jgi:hypothetical protein
MYNLYIGLGFLVALALLLIHFHPAATMEGFSLAGVDPVRSPACTQRSADAQKLLARFADVPQEDGDAAELRLLLSKLCCMEADISSPAAGVIRTIPLQFRTSHDMDVASTLVSRCQKGATNARDVDLVIEKFTVRGHALVTGLCDEPEAHAEFERVVSRLRWAMTTFCIPAQPSMDRPVGPRDVGFYETESVAELSQYQGISAAPK